MVGAHVIEPTKPASIATIAISGSYAHSLSAASATAAAGSLCDNFSCNVARWLQRDTYATVPAGRRPNPSWHGILSPATTRVLRTPAYHRRYGNEPPVSHLSN